MIRWLICMLLGHEYEKIKPLSQWSDLLGCKACKKLFAYNNNTQICLPWDSDFEKFYIVIDGGDTRGLVDEISLSFLR